MAQPEGYLCNARHREYYEATKALDERIFEKIITKERIRQDVIDNGGMIWSKSGIHGKTYAWFRACLYCLADHLVTEKPLEETSFLDLGSSIGNILWNAANIGFKTYGIDMDQECYEASGDIVEMAEKKGIIPTGRTKIAWGNFFPKEFKVKTSVRHDGFRDRINEHLLQLPDQDPYVTLGITPPEVDLFYHFQVERLDNILRFFAEYAHSGARLMFVHSEKDSPRLPKGVRMMESFGQDHVKLFQKD
ncbi:MAG: hypothetical protein WCV90_07345 [Candidatus Woesearchaeota archaeon]